MPVGQARHALDLLPVWGLWRARIKGSFSSAAKGLAALFTVASDVCLTGPGHGGVNNKHGVAGFGFFWGAVTYVLG